jgi:hypothetical protein
MNAVMISVPMTALPIAPSTSRRSLTSTLIIEVLLDFRIAGGRTVGDYRRGETGQVPEFMSCSKMRCTASGEILYECS